jgi:hypothetical protein
VDHAHGGGDERLIYLGGSLLQRVERTLRARDAVHVALNQPQNNDTADEALAAFDESVLLLMGAVDAAARVAHAVLGLAVPTHLVGWQRKQWLTELKKAHPTLAAVVAPGTAADATLKILRLMRNTVHGEAMSALTGGTGSLGTVKTRMSMPGVDQVELRAAVSAAGGEASWGISFERGGIRAEIDVLLERILCEVVETLNILMEETPVEKLAHVALAPDRCRAPDDPNDAVWSATNRLGVAWQLGLKGRAEHA